MLFVCSILLFSCKEHSQPAQNNLPASRYKEPLLNANKKLIKNEEDEIESLIHRYQWSMKKTGSGLRYMIYQAGSGQKAETGLIAKIKYSNQLINGNPCYSLEKEFLIGKGNVESGLEEAILFLKVGDKAKIILPSHLGFGLIGDQNKIPKRATLIYDLELIELKKIKN